MTGTEILNDFIDTQLTLCSMAFGDEVANGVKQDFTSYRPEIDETILNLSEDQLEILPELFKLYTTRYFNTCYNELEEYFLSLPYNIWCDMKNWKEESRRSNP